MIKNPFLRHLRARWMLSQDELAQLLGIHQGCISRYEQGVHPPLSVALALQVVFGKPPRSLFSAIYLQIEEQVMTRAAELEQQLRGKRDPASMRKKHMLEGMMARATSSSGA